MKLIFKILFLSIVIYSCKHESRLNSNRIMKESIQNHDFEIESMGNSIDLLSFFKDSNIVTWTDRGSFWLLYFNNREVNFEFTPTCGYSFPFDFRGDTLVFYWGLNMNCNFDLRLNRTYTGIKSPIIGEAFGEIRILSDSTLLVNYLYEDWIDKINNDEKILIDTLFPRYFKPIKL